ncbi:MAG: hypothetical protein J4452_00510 [Candidatus Aenigmarchaeota archaeon]|nr:hypothetical protein [Candidatus Aenigmarchaeota archaeon]
MSKQAQHKGLMKTFEAVIAVLLITTFFVLYYSTRDTLPEFDTVNRQIKAFNALKSLDESNQLRTFVTNNNAAGLTGALQNLMPANLFYQVVICNPDCTAPTLPNQKATSVFYFVGGDVNSLSTRMVVVYVWGET